MKKKILLTIRRNVRKMNGEDTVVGGNQINFW